MTIFGNPNPTAGCFSVFWADLSKSKGARFSGLASGTDFPADDDLNFLVTDLNFAQQEAFGHQRCFNDVNHLYTFGHSPGTASVSFLAFLKAGARKDDPTSDSSSATTSTIQDEAVIQKALDVYNENRLFKYKKEIKISFGSGGGCLSGYLIGMSSSTYNPSYNILQFTFNILSTRQFGEASANSP